MIIYTLKGKQQIKKGEKENVKSQIGVNKTYYQTTAGLTAYKESHVRQPGASGFCDRASEFCA